MLTIRDAQMKVFEQAAEQQFEDRMLSHSKAFSPRLSTVLGDARLRVAVRQAIVRARGHRLTNRGPIRLFIELSFLFGSAFDTDPQYPWAGEILEGADTDMARAEQLHERTIAYQKDVSGPGGVHTQQAFQELTGLAARTKDFSPETFAEAVRQELARTFPQKAAFVGEAGLDAILREAREAAARYGFSARGEALLVTLMFAFGHGCLSDPLYPWIGDTLGDDKIVSAQARADRLERKATTWLEHVIAGSGEA